MTWRRVNRLPVPLVVLAVLVVAGCASPAPQSRHNSYQFQQDEAARALQQLDKE